MGAARPPVGVREVVEAPSPRMTLRGGDVVVMMTDGVYEAYPGGEEALCAALSRLCWLHPRAVGEKLIAAALAGACAGYLIWNHYPAKVMMGDTGSMFLGGLVAALAFSVNCPLILIPVGVVYVIEALSDILQIGSIKLRHKKIFKMSPIHHHFEMSGWSEVKIVCVFSLITAIAGIIAIVLVYFGVVQLGAIKFA